MLLPAAASTSISTPALPRPRPHARPHIHTSTDRSLCLLQFSLIARPDSAQLEKGSVKLGHSALNKWHYIFFFIGPFVQRLPNGGTLAFWRLLRVRKEVLFHSGGGAVMNVVVAVEVDDIEILVKQNNVVT